MTTTHYEQQFTGNRHISTNYWTSHPIARHHTKPQLSGLLRDERNLDATRQTAYPTRTSTLTVFFQRTTITKTSSDETLTHLLLLPGKADDNATPTTTTTIPYIKRISEKVIYRSSRPKLETGCLKF